MGGKLYSPFGLIELATHDQTYLVHGRSRRCGPTMTARNLRMFSRDIKLRKICFYGNMYQNLKVREIYHCIVCFFELSDHSIIHALHSTLFYTYHLCKNNVKA